MKLEIGVMMAGAVLFAIPAYGQAGAARPSQEAAQPSVEGYLCTFAGKCGEQPAEQAEMDAPSTRGFRLARPTADRAAAAPAGGSRVRAPARGYAGPGRTETTPGRMRPRARPRTEAADAVARANILSAATPGTGVAATAPARRADLLIGFDVNSARLSRQGRESARVFAQALLRPELMSKRFVVEGHTDATGGRAINLALSQRRAEALVDALAAQGVDRSRLTARGLGPDSPLPGRRASDPANRRVEAELVR